MSRRRYIAVDSGEYREPVVREPRVSYAGRLRQEIAARALEWATASDVPFEASRRAGSLLFCAYGDGLHGNFFPASYRRILQRPQWRRRLAKPHTSARRILPSYSDEYVELDTAVSSDALLMSILSHPTVFRGSASRLRQLLSTEAPERIVYGYSPRIPLTTQHVERTEVDARIGNLLIEAKLTESDFQSAPLSRMLHYRDFESVFALDELPVDNGQLRQYQLLRGVLTAHAEPERRFCVMCDARRPDLIDAWYTVIGAVRMAELRSRLSVLTWQEIAAVLPEPLQEWLAAKYGIVAT